MKLKFLVLLALLSMVPTSSAQEAAGHAPVMGQALSAPGTLVPGTPPVNTCFTDGALGHQRQHVPGFMQRLEAMDAAVLAAGAVATGRQDLEIPVVVHVIHQGGTENIPDAQVIAGIQHLNDAFANAGAYAHPDGTATGIRFCLAAQDPAGGVTQGITRTVSPLTNMVAETQDLALKNLVRWDPDRYLNIWLVNEITSAAMGAGVAGYAYFPTSQGQPEDGIVNEARFFGSTLDNSKVHIHEAGHYLGLYHTFEGGCANSDCLTDGDRVCDTPPDNSTAAVPCHAQPNTCQTDGDDPAPHNPFRPVALGGLGDQPDPFKNYMDYGYQACQAYFSPGQAGRMLAAITTQRAVLLESNACETPCLDPISVSITPASTTIEVGQTVQFSGTHTGASSYAWTIQGQVVGTGPMLDHLFTEAGWAMVEFTAYNDDPNCVATASATVQVTCPAQAAFMLTAAPPFQPGEAITAVSTSANNTTTQWVLDGVPVGTGTTWTGTFTEVGGHALYVVAGSDPCADTSTTRFFQVGNCDLSGVTNDWVFLNNRIRFVDGQPVLDPNSPIQDHNNECSSSIADIDGNLLLASDGVNIYDRDLNVMPNGSGLLGHMSSTQGVLITPHPGNTNQYFVFTTDAIENDQMQNGMRYSLVDMTLNGGLGDVLPALKNKPLLARGSEKLSATWHANGRDIWVGSGEYSSNAWYAFLIDSEGIHTTPVISHIGTPPNNNPIGSMRFSNDGNRMAACMITAWPWRILVSDFDRGTGVYSNPIELILSTEFNQQPFSLAFSPDNSKLYVSFWQGEDAIFQYDLSQTTAAGIMASQYSVTSPASFCSSGHLVLASDGKIYVRECTHTGLSAIQDPNAAGAACDYVRNVVPMSAAFENNSNSSLPNMMQGFYLAHQPTISGPKNICVGGEPVEFGITFGSQLDSAVWTHAGPGQFISQDGADTGTLISGNETGTDTIMVTVHGRCGISHDTLVVNTNLPETTQLSDITFLECDSVVLDPGAGFLSYTWSNATYESTLATHDAGWYGVLVKGASGCSIEDSTLVLAYDDVELLDLGPDRSMCEGQVTVLGTVGNFAEYLWQDGSQEPVFTAHLPGTYWVRVTDACTGAERSDTVVIALSELVLHLQYQGTDRVCTTELPFTLEAPDGFEAYYWDDGRTTPSIHIDTMGTYVLTALHANGCSVRDTLWVEACGLVGEAPDHDRVRIHPNPAADHFILSSRLPITGTLELRTLSGRIVHREQVVLHGEMRVPVRHLANGLYLLELRSSAGIWREKVSVVR